MKSILMCVQNLTILRERCSDPALSVRKQALQSLAGLLDTFPQNKLVQKYVVGSYFITNTCCWQAVWNRDDESNRRFMPEIFDF